MKTKAAYLKFIFAAALLFWLVRSGRLDLSALLSLSSGWYYAVGLVLVAACLLVQIFRWWMLLKVQGVALSFRRALWLSWVSFFISLAIPGMAGGVLSRAYLVSRDVAADRLEAVSTVIMDRFMGLTALLVMGITSLFAALIRNGWDSGLAPIWVATAAACGALGAAVAMAWAGLKRQRLFRLLPAVLREPLVRMAAAYRGRGKVLLKGFLLSFLAALITMGAFMVAGRALGDSLSWGQACQVVPLVFVAGTLPLAPDGIGVSETASALLFSRHGIASGASIMLVYRFWLLLLRLPGGILFLFHKAKSA
jgi:uncharacterized membrane protein YbhN (UPF0104 family)